VATALVGTLVLGACAETSPRPETTGSPLGPYRELAYGTAGEQADRTVALQRRYEERVATCMKDAGFEYVPVVTSPDSVVLDEDVPPPGSRAFREQFGYGLASSPWQDVAAEDVPDPNAGYRAALTPGAQAAFDEELYGTPEVDAAGITAQVGGCANAAWDDVYGVLASNPGWDRLLAEMDALQDRALDAQAARDVDRAWSRCMADRGHVGLADPAAAEESVRTLLAGAQVRAEDGLVAADAGSLADVGAAEVTLAVADLDCQEQVDLRGRKDAVLRTLEEEFVEQHRDELEAWALAEQARQE